MRGEFLTARTEIDIKRQRVALTMRLNDTPTKNTNSSTGAGFQAKPSQTSRQMAIHRPGSGQGLKSAPAQGSNAMADAFDKLAKLKGEV